MQLTQPANNSKNASDHCLARTGGQFRRNYPTPERGVPWVLSLLWPFFSSCFNYISSKWLIFQIEINKKHNFWKIYHSWFDTNDNKTSVIERKQNHKLWIINTAYIRGFTCVLNLQFLGFSVLTMKSTTITVSISRNPGHSVSLTEKVLHKNGIKKLMILKLVLFNCLIILHEYKQGKSEGFDSCDQPSNQFKLYSNQIFQPIWPRNLMDDLEKQ